MARSRQCPCFPPLASTPAKNTTHSRQHGQGAVEFLLAAIPVLLIALSSIEAIHWYFARQAVSLALVQAARAAVTQHADPAVLDQAFAQALLPMHAGPTPEATQARLQGAITRRERDTHLPAWRIRILSPSAASFSDFSSHSPDLPQIGKPVIDNDYLHEQLLNHGGPASRGTISGQNTLEANTLVLHLTWLHEPLLPGMKQVLKQIAPRDQRYGSRAMARAGYLPLQRRVELVMQSHPIAWDMPAHGRISRASRADAAEENDVNTKNLTDSEDKPGPHESLPCTGLWCLQDYSAEKPSGGGDNEGATAPDPGASNTEAGGEHHEGGYLGSEPGDAEDVSTPPDIFDDCPGCCD